MQYSNLAFYFDILILVNDINFINLDSVLIKCVLRIDVLLGILSNISMSQH